MDIIKWFEPFNEVLKQKKIILLNAIKDTNPNIKIVRCIPFYHSCGFLGFYIGLDLLHTLYRDGSDFIRNIYMPDYILYKYLPEGCRVHYPSAQQDIDKEHSFVLYSNDRRDTKSFPSFADFDGDTYNLFSVSGFGMNGLKSDSAVRLPISSLGKSSSLNNLNKNQALITQCMNSSYSVEVGSEESIKYIKVMFPLLQEAPELPVKERLYVEYMKNYSSKLQCLITEVYPDSTFSDNDQDLHSVIAPYLYDEKNINFPAPKEEYIPDFQFEVYRTPGTFSVTTYNYLDYNINSLKALRLTLPTEINMSAKNIGSSNQFNTTHYKSVISFSNMDLPIIDDYNLVTCKYLTGEDCIIKQLIAAGDSLTEIGRLMTMKKYVDVLAEQDQIKFTKPDLKTIYRILDSHLQRIWYFIYNGIKL